MQKRGRNNCFVALFLQYFLGYSSYREIPFDGIAFVICYFYSHFHFFSCAVSGFIEVEVYPVVGLLSTQKKTFGIQAVPIVKQSHTEQLLARIRFGKRNNQRVSTFYTYGLIPQYLLHGAEHQ